MTNREQSAILSEEPLSLLVIIEHLFSILERIRLGTFNVNGNLPTQDLGAWVGGSDRDADTRLPLLKKLSEITLGESDSKEGEYRHRSSIPYAVEIDTPS